MESLRKFGLVDFTWNTNYVLAFFSLAIVCKYNIIWLTGTVSCLVRSWWFYYIQVLLSTEIISGVCTYNVMACCYSFWEFG